MNPGATNANRVTTEIDVMNLYAAEFAVRPTHPAIEIIASMHRFTYPVRNLPTNRNVITNHLRNTAWAVQKPSLRHTG